MSDGRFWECRWQFLKAVNCGINHQLCPGRNASARRSILLPAPAPAHRRRGPAPAPPPTLGTQSSTPRAGGARRGRTAGRGHGDGPQRSPPVPGCRCRPSARSVPTARFSAVASYCTRVAASARARAAGTDCRRVINVHEAAVITPARLAFPFAMSLCWDGVWQSLFPNHSFFTVKGYFLQAASRDFIV